ncbi:uncharacterized protein LOC121082144 [Falco naumanni]|uniref:uncharacterized protein LOC121082144 n=1 Tax=Falco naumanni TaxID=148594 RepID=UPI001ADE4B1C|nr:uncharacterized protein LOC121082144 [Falco naumanni]
MYRDPMVNPYTMNITSRYARVGIFKFVTKEIIELKRGDAAWEEEGSFLDLVHWQSSCDADQCLCPLGRDQAEQAGWVEVPWDAEPGMAQAAFWQLSPGCQDGSRVELGSAQCRCCRPTARGPLVAAGTVALPRPWRVLVCSSGGSRETHQCCSALEDATESWECRDCSGTHSGEGGSGRTGCPGRGGFHSHWGLGDRRCDAWREGAWQGLVVLIFSLPLAVPDIVAGPDSGPLAQGPWHSAPSSVTPGTLAEEEEARLLEGQPDTRVPFQLLRKKPADPH